jgi:hypothetical protein
MAPGGAVEADSVVDARVGAGVPVGVGHDAVSGDAAAELDETGGAGVDPPATVQLARRIATITNSRVFTAASCAKSGGESRRKQRSLRPRTIALSSSIGST